VNAFAADRSFPAQARRLSREVIATYLRLPVLVNEAGRFRRTSKLTTDGQERAFAASHLAGFLPADRLPDRLKAQRPRSDPDRVLWRARHGPDELR
jgi:NAD(P)-dependent dehydrogenase (short-subunit alcohol dehydrogenase family)